MPGAVEEATREEVDALGEPLSTSALASAAIALARKIDKGTADAMVSPSAVASAVRTLSLILDRLAAQRPAAADAPAEGDELDDLQARRQARLAGG